VSDSIETLRTALAEALRPPLRVSKERTQYWFDDDSAAAAHIDVQDGRSGFQLVVIDGTGAPAAGTAFIVRAWDRYARETWVLDARARTVERVDADGGRRVQHSGEILSAPFLPGFAVEVDALFERRPPGTADHDRR
jgi:hypothetical protein